MEFAVAFGGDVLLFKIVTACGCARPARYSGEPSSMKFFMSSCGRALSSREWGVLTVHAGNATFLLDNGPAEQWDVPRSIWISA